MTDTGNIQWENSNQGRNYPFSDDSTLIDNLGNVMPRDIIADIHIMFSSWDDINAGTESSEGYNAFVSCVHLGPELVSVSISRGGGLGGLLTVHVSKSSFTPFTPVPLNSYTDDTYGFITFGDIDWPSVQSDTRIWRFSSAEQSGIERTACTPVKTARIRRFIDDDAKTELHGKVRFDLPSYVTARFDEEDPYSVVFELLPEADNLFKSPCFKDLSLDVCGVPAIQSINGVFPNENGEIALRFL